MLLLPTAFFLCLWATTATRTGSSLPPCGRYLHALNHEKMEPRGISLPLSRCVGCCDPAMWKATRTLRGPGNTAEGWCPDREPRRQGQHRPGDGWSPHTPPLAALAGLQPLPHPMQRTHRAILQPQVQDLVPGSVVLHYLSRPPDFLRIRNPDPVVLRTDRRLRNCRGHHSCPLRPHTLTLTCRAPCSSNLGGWVGGAASLQG